MKRNLCGVSKIATMLALPFWCLFTVPSYAQTNACDSYDIGACVEPGHQPILGGGSHSTAHPQDDKDQQQWQQAEEEGKQGWVLLKSGQATAAIPAFQHALSRRPYATQLLVGLAQADVAVGQLDDAIKVYRKFFYRIKEEDNNGDSNTTLLMQYALVLLQANREEEALAIYDRGFHYLPDDFGILPPHFTASDYNVTRFNPAEFQAAAYGAMGIYDYVHNHQDAAINELEQAKRIQPKKAPPYYWLALIWQNKPGHSADATVAFHKALQYDTSSMMKLSVMKALRIRAAESAAETKTASR